MIGDDLVSLFQEQAVATPGTDLFLSSKAVPKTGTVLVVIETSGMKPERVHNEVQPRIRRPSAQISARANSRPEAVALIEAAYVAVCTVVNRTLNGRPYLAITPLQEPGDMGTDDQGRIKFGFNVLAEHGRA